MMSSQILGVMVPSLPCRYLLTASILFLASRSTGRKMASFQSRSSFSLPSFFLAPGPTGTATVPATRGWASADRVTARTATRRTSPKAARRRGRVMVRVLELAAEAPGVVESKLWPGRMRADKGKPHHVTRPSPGGRARHPIVVDEAGGGG